MTTKPYAAGGAYINRMSDYCGGCPYDPKRRTGDDACPYTAGTGRSCTATGTGWRTTTG
jgi:deoxyribodipyrimidine photolyase-related protein